MILNLFKGMTVKLLNKKKIEKKKNIKFKFKILIMSAGDFKNKGN